ncbi:DNA methyltransferase [uncultured Thiodictyon sp.]|jgi:type II restriction/modification system DNA methylase subunit YeeA|uniref:class I SAM-dependent DNA methyltransferase n=1 Tax=uncultured Thiodictyon sp. TaxID=1846217 RepID=UPI0025DB7D5C|nr:DNA methyltransferase [uncultured Thiodictyon sp.]
MTPDEFIAAWKDNPLTERAGAQQWFSDLCDLLDVPKPRDADNYCFERGARKSGGGEGWADVWKRGHFGWENKKPGRDLNGALKQLTDYALNLESPPLLVVADRERIIIHTAFTGYPDEPREIRIDDLGDPAQREILRWVFTDPEKLKPTKSCQAITKEAATKFANLAETMRKRGEDWQRVAHFLVQCLFCLFAEDERLLPGNLFADLLKNAQSDTGKAAKRLGTLFLAMQSPHGEYGDHDIAWFNGGLFNTIDIPPLLPTDLAELHCAARDMDWRAIDPTIFGTLFERGLDPAARAPLGAHYTDVDTIGKLIDPVITQPLLREWETAKAVIEAGQGKKGPTRKARDAYQGFLLRLYEFRVLDPACGSGNFLYLALKALRDLEKRVQVEARDLGIPTTDEFLQTGPHNILGLEINEFAAELARVTVWIGDIQWCRRNGYQHSENPILKPLDAIEHRDALINPDGTEAAWPTADVIVGNPPFLGDKKMLGGLGTAYVTRLRKRYDGRVPGGADLVTYWFEKARAQIAAGKTRCAGLVATNSIRGGANRKVLDRIVETGAIFNAWSDEPWVNEGAAVRVSLVAFAATAAERPIVLDGNPIPAIYADLSGSTAEHENDLTGARVLSENLRAAIQGPTKGGAFDIPGVTARGWLVLPNIHGKPTSDVLKPWLNGLDVTRRHLDNWIIDFADMDEADASLYEAPFEHVRVCVFPARQGVARERRKRYWWQFNEPAPGLRAALSLVSRYIATPEVSKHRVFVWLNAATIPDKNLVAIVREDDATFGVLHSRPHRVWALKMGTSLENRPRYTSSSTFRTFPFPDGLTPADTKGPTEALASGAVLPTVAADRRAVAARIAEAAYSLNARRESWLNPKEWIERVPEVVPGYPDRIIPAPGHEAELKTRTLTNLYNKPPAWLNYAHQALDAAVAAAYEWTDYTAQLPDEEILRRLLALNLQRPMQAKARKAIRPKAD